MEADYYERLGSPENASEVEGLTLVRSTKRQTLIPGIDLRPYQAYESAVSRLPANINLSLLKATLKDLEPANGIWLNGLRLEAFQEQVLHKGDSFTFGQMKTQGLFQE